MALIKLNISKKMRLYQDKVERQKMKDLYHEAFKDSMKILKLYEGDTTATGYLQRLRLNQLTDRLAGVYLKMPSESEKIVTDSMKRVVNSVMEDTSKFYASVGLKFGTAYASVPEDVISSIRLGKVYQGNWTLSKAIWGDSLKIQEEINTIVAKGLAMNKSSLEIAKDLEKYVNPKAKKPWDWGKVYPGVRTKIDYNAQRLSRTLVSHAYQQSIIQTSKLNPFAQGIRWYASNSDRTCQLCHDRAESDSYGLGAGVFPIDDLPLDHPNGMCTYAVVLIAPIDKLHDRVIDWTKGLSDEELDTYLAERCISPL